MGSRPYEVGPDFCQCPVRGNYNWTGFLPTSKLPHSFNPAAGFVATANHKMIPEHYPYKVGYEWEPPYRFERIRSVIEDAQHAQHKLTIADMEALQNDVVSLACSRAAKPGAIDVAAGQSCAHGIPAMGRQSHPRIA